MMDGIQQYLIHQTEHDFIEQKMKEFNAEHSCWIGGSTNIDEKNPIHFSQYIQNSTGKKTKRCNNK